MNDLKQWYSDISYKDAKIILKTNIENMTRSFVAVGYYLKYIRDTEGYREDGYGSIWDFAESEYGLQRSTASRWMAINDRFSDKGNSPVLADRYNGFGKSQLQEMLYLTDEQVEDVTPDMTVKEIREIRKPEPTADVLCETCISNGECVEKKTVKNGCLGYDKAVSKAEAASLSALGYPRRVYPPDSLIATPGCDNQKCFGCHLSGCAVRGEECWCVYAPCGNPFPCTVLKQAETLQEEVGSICQFVDVDLAKVRADGMPVPCCEECETPCKYECSRSAAKRKKVEAAQEPDAAQPEPSDLADLHLPDRTRDVLETAGISTQEQLKSMNRDQMAAIRNMGKRMLDGIQSALSACATSHTENEQPAEATPEPEKDEAWFVKEYFARYGGEYLPELMRICRENRLMSGKVKAVRDLIGICGGGSIEFGYNFGSYNSGVSFNTDDCAAEVRMPYRGFVLEMIKLYDPWDPKWMPSESETANDREPEEESENGTIMLETASGQEETESIGPICESDTPETVSDQSEIESRAGDTSEPRFTSLFLRDILHDRECGLAQMEELNEEARVKNEPELPERMMQEHRAVVAGLRLLLEYTETREKVEEEDEEDD